MSEVSPPAEARPQPRLGRQVSVSTRAVRLALLLVGSLPIWAAMPQSVPVIGSLSAVLQTVLGVACQNDPTRALAPWGTPLAVCARCSGLYFGLALGALLMRPRLRRAAAWAWLGCGLLLMALDVATEQLLMRPPSAPLRLMTGILVSYPAALLALAVHPRRRNGDAK